MKIDITRSLLYVASIGMLVGCKKSQRQVTEDDVIRLIGERTAKLETQPKRVTSDEEIKQMKSMLELVYRRLDSLENQHIGERLAREGERDGWKTLEAGQKTIEIPPLQPTPEAKPALPPK